MRAGLILWMYGVVAGHLIIGMLLPWLAGWPLLEGYHRYLEFQFWGQNVPSGVRSVQVWWISLLGATISCMSLWMGALVYFGARYRNPVAWSWLIFGILLWAPQDMWISLQHNAWLHVYFDIAALLAMLPPLLCLWWIDRQQARMVGAA
ncbi:MAG: cell division protein [Burkholderiales bacterium]|nr:cell division protein [Burkholderiales bacterium]